MGFHQKYHVVNMSDYHRGAVFCTTEQRNCTHFPRAIRTLLCDLKRASTLARESRLVAAAFSNVILPHLSILSHCLSFLSIDQCLIAAISSNQRLRYMTSLWKTSQWRHLRVECVVIVDSNFKHRQRTPRCRSIPIVQRPKYSGELNVSSGK